MLAVTLARRLILLAVLPLGGCYVAPDAFAPFSAPVGSAYAPLRDGEYDGATCAAGAYVCQAPPGPPGTQCSCPGLGAPSFGVIR